MTRRRAYSLLQRLTLAFAVVAALVFALTGAYLYRSLSAELTRRDDIEISGKLNQFLQLAHASGSIAALRPIRPCFTRCCCRTRACISASTMCRTARSSSIPTKPAIRWRR